MAFQATSQIKGQPILPIGQQFLPLSKSALNTPSKQSEMQEIINVVFQGSRIILWHTCCWSPEFSLQLPMHQNSFPSLKKVVINYQKATTLEAWQPRSLERAGKAAGWFVGYHRRLHTVGLDITILIPILGIKFMPTTLFDVLFGKFQKDYICHQNLNK